jgi:hypothetical protein
MHLSVVIPAFNEAATIGAVLARVRAALAQLQAQGVSGDIVVVNDASTDGTLTVAQSLASSDLVVLSHDYNKGKGAAVRTGFAHALQAAPQTSNTTPASIPSSSRRSSQAKPTPSSARDSWAETPTASSTSGTQLPTKPSPCSPTA